MVGMSEMDQGNSCTSFKHYVPNPLPGCEGTVSTTLNNTLLKGEIELWILTKSFKSAKLETNF